MFDPEQKGKPKTKVSGVVFEPPPPPRVVYEEGIRSSESSLKYYIKESQAVWEAHGLKKVNGRFVVADLEKIKGFNESTKEILREVLREQSVGLIGHGPKPH